MQEVVLVAVQWGSWEPGPRSGLIHKIVACLRTRVPLLVPGGGSAPPRNEDGEWRVRREEGESGEKRVELNCNGCYVVMLPRF